LGNYNYYIYLFIVLARDRLASTTTKSSVVPGVLEFGLDSSAPHKVHRLGGVL